MDIRNYQRGDEEDQAAIYNEAAASIPKFKPATVHEVQRRIAAADFDPASRFYAIEDGRAVGYALFNANGRVSFPWCRKGFEHCAAPLFQRMIDVAGKRGFRKLFAAYRGDWPIVLEFFTKHGFVAAQEMVNFVLDAVNMPTMLSRPSGSITPLLRSDLPVLFSLAPHVLHSTNTVELERHLFDNLYFPPSDVFVLRSRTDQKPIGAGILIRNVTYGDPHKVDAAMPCYRLGAFGTEGMQAKRLNGMFSFLCRDDGQAGGIASDLLSHAASLLRDGDEVSALAAQVPSDAPNLLRFYEMTWRRQGSFPILEYSALSASSAVT